MQQNETGDTTPLGAPYPVLIRGHSLRKTRQPQGSTTQLNESFDAITLDSTTRGGSGSARADPQAPGRYWDAERRESSLLDEDFDLMTSSAGLTTERGSIYDSPPRSRKSLGKARQQETDYKRPLLDRVPQIDTDFNPNGNSQIPDEPRQALKVHQSSPDRSNKLHTRRRSGPRFEVVKSQVVEDGPERTVTVSLWREQVTKPIGPNGETMSVHYYSADDVLPDGHYRSSSVIYETGDKPTRHGTSPQEKTTSELSYRQRSPQPSANRSDIYYDRSPPHASTPIRAQPNTTMPAAPTYTYHVPHLSPRSHVSQSSQDISHAADMSISTVKSQSTIELEKILDSCEPSLIHVAPILACLGITREQHLKAIGRLSEETRDREVKEEALRLGMTVMEWAILLDKLHSL